MGVEVIKGFCAEMFAKLRSELAGHLAKIMAPAIIAATLILLGVFRGWATTKHSVEIYGWMWLVMSGLILFVCCHFLRAILYDWGRLKKPQDVFNAIDYWFTERIDGTAMITWNRPYRLSDFEKELNIGRTRSRWFLPVVASLHGYDFEIDIKTFRMVGQLPRQKHPTEVLTRSLRSELARVGPNWKEVVISCGRIDEELNWPRGSTKWLFLRRGSRPFQDASFPEAIIEDHGGDQIRIVRV